MSNLTAKGMENGEGDNLPRNTRRKNKKQDKQDKLNSEASDNTTPPEITPSLGDKEDPDKEEKEYDEKELDDQGKGKEKVPNVNPLFA